MALDKSWSVLKFNVEEPNASKAPNITGTTAYAAPGESLPQSESACPKCAQLQAECNTLRAQLAQAKGGQM